MKQTQVVVLRKVGDCYVASIPAKIVRSLGWALGVRLVATETRKGVELTPEK